MPSVAAADRRRATWVPRSWQALIPASGDTTADPRSREAVRRRKRLGSDGAASGQPFIAVNMWFSTFACACSGLKRMTSASFSTRTLCPGGQ